jgi:predicted 3-demethylubiquinone-9 3-methyltransferase (glyoxalase superfamily)
MKNIIPNLWFNDQAETAAELYTSIFPASHIDSVSRYRESGAQASGMPAGSVLSVSFELDGQPMAAINGGPYYKFSPAISFFINCRTVNELDQIWALLLPGGSVLMELGQYPFSERYGWLTDRFGVSWQLMLSSEQTRIVPCLLFTRERYGQAEEAINFYTAALPDSAIEAIERLEDGKVLYSAFTLHGQRFTAMESDLDHAFTFTPAISFLITCESQEEVDRLWETFGEGGLYMPCGWLTDRFGVTWQIDPAELFDLINNEDTVKAERAMQAMLKMHKIDLAELRRAFNDEG